MTLEDGVTRGPASSFSVALKERLGRSGSYRPADLSAGARASWEVRCGPGAQAARTETQGWAMARGGALARGQTWGRVQMELLPGHVRPSRPSRGKLRCHHMWLPRCASRTTSVPPTATLKAREGKQPARGHPEGQQQGGDKKGHHPRPRPIAVLWASVSSTVKWE